MIWCQEVCGEAKEKNKIEKSGKIMRRFITMMRRLDKNDARTIQHVHNHGV